MKKNISSLIVLLLSASCLYAQDFITRGKIEYEMKVNFKRKFEQVDNGDIDMSYMPETSVTYRQLLFADNRWVYEPIVKEGQTAFMGEGSFAYVNLDTKERVVKKQFFADFSIFKDSLYPVKWKIENETRKIAGWECRKAVGRIYDSVYVVAFYCPEIIPQGGPEFFTGLPGMILGVAIPRYFTTWFATKVEIANLDESKIAVPTLKKVKQYSRQELADYLLKQYQGAIYWQKTTPAQVQQYIGDYLL